MGKKKRKSGGTGNQDQQSTVAAPQSSVSQPTTSAASEGVTGQQKPQHERGGDIGDGFRGGRGGGGGKGDRQHHGEELQQQKPQHEGGGDIGDGFRGGRGGGGGKGDRQHHGEELQQQKPQHEGGGDIGDGFRGGRGGGGGKGDRQHHGEELQQQKPQHEGGGDGQQWQTRGSRGGQGRGSPMPSQGSPTSGDGGQYSHGRGVSPVEPSQGPGAWAGRGRGEGRGGGRGVFRGSAERGGEERGGGRGGVERGGTCGGRGRGGGMVDGGRGGFRGSEERGGGRGGRGRGAGVGGVGQQPQGQYIPPQRQQTPEIATKQFPSVAQPHFMEHQPQRPTPPSVQQVEQGVQQLQVQKQRAPSTQQQQTQMVRSQPSASLASSVIVSDVPEEVPENFRKGGTQGRRIKVLANHFQISMAQKISTAYQYDVALDPDRPKKLLPVVMQQFQRTFYPKNFPAFDGRKILFSANRLPLQLPFTASVNIMEEDQQKEYKVAIQFAREVDVSALAKFFSQLGGQNHMLPPMHVLQCLDVVLRSRPSTCMIIAGRSFFSVPDRIETLGNGMQMYRGFYQSAILGWKPFLNIDVSHKPFPTRMPVLDLIRELDNRVDIKRDLDRNTTMKLEKFLKMLKVEYTIPNQPASRRQYRVNGLEQSAKGFKFVNDDGKEMTVEGYFRTVKHYTLQYPHLPTLWVGNKQRKPKMVLPCELCVVLEGQVVNRKMDEMQTRNMIKHAATSTTVRKDNIMQSMRIANHNSSPSMHEFGLSIDPNMTEVTARVLAPPSIKYKNQNQNVLKGVWRGAAFWQPSMINKWAIVCFDNKIYDQELVKMKDMFVRQGANVGMRIDQNIQPTKISLNYNYGQKDIRNYFDQCKRDGMQLVVVVLLDMNKSCYSWVKKAAELNAGCLTQCIKSNTMRRMNDMTVDNILLKINAKLNGVNHLLAEPPLVLRQPVMLMGADVTHPPPESREGTPSVAAVTASNDPQAFCYNIVWRLQDPRAEIITDLENITREQLLFFNQKTKLKPEKIIFYRDGVSDGQFEIVRRQEIQAVRNACKSLSPDYKPPLTFIVVQKRHHTRLFPCDTRVSEDRNGNVPAGTCVDTQITHPTAQDFYLVSHASIQGVARPTKYRTIWDDSDFSDDGIEQLTYYLCHLFARCNRSVSYPAPTYYAHLAAARAKVYIEEENLDMRNLQTAHKLQPIMEVIQKQHPMFFI